MPQQELLKKVVSTLNQLGIEYMLTGSFVSSLQGEPRMTHDIDIVVDIQPNKVKDLASYFDSENYYLDVASAIEAIGRKDMFNLIDSVEGDKVDFWILTDEPFDQSRFSRKYAEKLFGVNINVSKPEDTILVKLRWAKLIGGSEKHLTDALRIMEIYLGKLDQTYLDEWAERLRVSDLLNQLKNKLSSG